SSSCRASDRRGHRALAAPGLASAPLIAPSLCSTGRSGLSALVEEVLVGGLSGFDRLRDGLAEHHDRVNQVTLELIQDFLPGAVGAVWPGVFGLFGDELLVLRGYVRTIERLLRRHPSWVAAAGFGHLAQAFGARNVLEHLPRLILELRRAGDAKA